METYFDTYVRSGGLLMIPLIFCSLVLVASVIQQMIRLRRGRVIPDYLLEEIGELADRNERIAYVRSLAQHPSPLAKAVRRTLEELEARSGQEAGKRQLESIAAEASAEVADEMYHEVGPLETLYTVGPLLGLLGTIIGMMNAFSRFAEVENKSVAVLSAGIKVALVTTMWGLIVAIPSYVASRYFHGRIRRYERELLPRGVLEIFGALFPHPAAAEPSPAGAAKTAAPTRTQSAALAAPPRAQGEVT